MNLYKRCTVKPYSFLEIDTTLVSDNPLHFRKNLLETMMIRLEMKKYNMILTI